jgi:peptidoglycan/xylan/chitin deacetylase (PgdA/CDA1 family)
VNILAGVFPLSLLQKLMPRDVTSVFYHAFGDEPIPHVTPLFPCKTAKDFERDLIYLKSRFQIVDHDEVVAHREGRRALAPQAAMLSFDDGFTECFSLARPLLLEHRLPATFFVCDAFIDNRALMHRNKVALCVSRLAGCTPDEAAGWAAKLQARFQLPSVAMGDIVRWLQRLAFDARETIDAVCECLGIDVAAYLRERRPYMTRAQIAQLHADGFTIGAHTSDHPQLAELRDWAEVRRQVRLSCDAVRQITGRRRVPFAFPFNGLSLPRQALAALREELGIDLMYDTNNLMPDREFIVNRIWCDTPRRASPKSSNLPALVWRAHALEPLRAAKRRLAGLPR